MIFYDLPEGQRRVLHFVMRFIDENEQSPTQAEIADGLGMLEQQVYSTLKALEKKKKIKRIKGAHRSIVVSKGGE